MFMSHKIVSFGVAGFFISKEQTKNYQHLMIFLTLKITRKINFAVKKMIIFKNVPFNGTFCVLFECKHELISLSQ